MVWDEQITKSIEELVCEIRRENEIINEIIRDDVFSILQGCDCTVLYFPLKDEDPDGCSGCHLEKSVNGQLKQFVFINTANTRERQAFSAAHELGHIWKVDERIRRLHPDREIDAEVVVNRFAAELLMPRELFEKTMDEQLKKMQYTGPAMPMVEMLKLIAYLMNYFFVPYKSVVRRFEEIGRINADTVTLLMRFKDSDYLNEIIKAEQYTRLGIVNNLKSMDNLQEYLLAAEQQGLVSETKVKNIREDFDIQTVVGEDDEKIEF